MTNRHWLTSPLILIGPLFVGKTTTARLLAAALDLPVVDVDALRQPYYAELGESEEKHRLIQATQGWAALLTHWEPLEVGVLERALAEPAVSVLDVGGGYTTSADPLLAARLQAVLAPQPHVILLLPTPEPSESVRFLAERFGGRLPKEFPLEDHVQRHFAAMPFAKQVVYVAGKTPEAVRDEILASVFPVAPSR